MLIINLKNYPLEVETFCLHLNSLIESRFHSISVALAPANIDTTLAMRFVKYFRVISQHADNTQSVKSTGYTSPSLLSVRKVPIVLLNHSEHRLTLNEIKETTKLLSGLGIETVIGFNQTSELEELNNFGATYYLFEPENLIGTSNTPGSKSVVDEMRNELSVLANKSTPGKILIGAGIKSEADFKEVYSLGFAGVALSSIVTESGNIPQKLEEILGYEYLYAPRYIA